jgi:hypothetical protein
LRRLARQKAAKLKPETAEFNGQKPQQDEVSPYRVESREHK